MNTPMFSIIVPIYNTEAYLRRCLDSIVNQTFKDFEVILVNDGSTDKCLDICIEYAEKDHRIRVIHQKNEGVSKARNEGLLKSKGKYIIFIDSDDFIHEKSCERFMDIIDKEYHIDVIAAQNERIKGNARAVLPSYIIDSTVTGYDFLRLQLKNKKFFSNVYRNVYNRDFLFKNNLFFINGYVAEDFEWTPRVFLLAKSVVTIDFPYYKSVFREGSIMQSQDKTKFIDDALVIMYLLENVFEEVEDNELKALLMNYLVNTFLNTFMHKKFYKKEPNEKKTKSSKNDFYNELFDKNFIRKKALTYYNKLRVMLFCFNKNLYYYVNRAYRKMKGV